MQHAQLQIPARRELDQGVQQEHRIGAARNRDPDTIPGSEHVITGDSFEDSFKQHSDSIRILTDISILTLDAGSSSVRTLLYDANARQVEGFGSQLTYEANTTADGGVEIDADKLLALVVHSLSDIHGQMQSAGRRASAFAFSSFWHNLLGVDASGLAVTPILHPFDTRSLGAAKKLAERIDGAAQHSRTGCVLHPSYWPPKLLWLSESQP